MKILQIANGYLGSRQYELLFNTLSDIGIESQIFAPENYKTAAVNTKNLIVCPCFNTLDRILFFTKQQKILRKIQDSYDINEFNIIHAHTVFSGGYAAYKLSEKYGIPYVITVRNTDVNVFFKYMLHLRNIGVKIMRKASEIVFLSPVYLKKVLKTYIPECFRDEIDKKSVVIPNGIDPLFLKNQPLPKKPESDAARLIYVGELSSNKNFETTVKAARMLREKGLNIHLTAVGKIREEKYRKLIKKTPFIKYSPYCPKEEVLEHLREADIFVMPSHTETFGLVYAEAISQGLPVLYTAGQGFDGQFAEGQVGFHVNDRDPDDIADKILAVIADYSALSERCITGAQKFDAAGVAGEYKKIYNLIKGEN